MYLPRWPTDNPTLQYLEAVEWDRTDRRDRRDIWIGRIGGIRTIGRRGMKDKRGGRDMR